MATLDRPWESRGNGRNDPRSIRQLIDELNASDREFRLHSWSEVERACIEAGGVQWVIEDIIERGTMGVLYGPPGAAKTFVSLDMSCSVSSGEPFAGRQVTQGVSVYVGGEGARAFGRRLMAWREGRGVPGPSDDFLYVSARVGLVNERNVEALGDAIEEHCSAQGKSLELLTFDTWQRHLEGDENSTGESSRACRNIFLLRDRFDCAINVLHHTGWGEGGRIRGARVLEGECDSMWQINLDESRNVTTVLCERMRDGDAPPPLTFKGRKVDVGHGTSWCIDFDPAERPAGKAEASLGTKETGVLRLVRELYRGEQDRMAANGGNPMAAEVTILMVREQVIARGIYEGEGEKTNRALSNVLNRLRDKRLIARRGKANMVPL